MESGTTTIANPPSSVILQFTCFAGRRKSIHSLRLFDSKELYIASPFSIIWCVMLVVFPYGIFVNNKSTPPILSLSYGVYLCSKYLSTANIDSSSA